MGGIQGSLKFAGLAAYSSIKAVITLSELLAEEYKEEVYHLMYWLWSRSDRNVGRGFPWIRHQ
jgi:hypothetical protein